MKIHTCLSPLFTSHYWAGIFSQNENLYPSYSYSYACQNVLTSFTHHWEIPPIFRFAKWYLVATSAHGIQYYLFLANIRGILCNNRISSLSRFMYLCSVGWFYGNSLFLVYGFLLNERNLLQNFSFFHPRFCMSDSEWMNEGRLLSLFFNKVAFNYTSTKLME